MTTPRTRRAAAPGVRSGVPPIETEWQFDAEDLEAVAAWLARPGVRAGLDVGPGESCGVRDTYLDTADWVIFRAGCVLRVREAAGRCEATLKGLKGRDGALAVRRELTQPLERPTLAAIFAAAGPVRDVIQQLAAPRALRVRGAIVTRRQTHALLAADGPVASLTLDRTRLVRPATRKRLLRVEVEVLHAAVERVRPFVGQLQRACGLVPARLTKAEWAFAALGLPPSAPAGPPGGPAVDAGQSTGEVARAVMRRHLAVLRWNEPGARLGDDPEFVHDMRVASRRLRAALRLFGGVHAAATTRRLRDGLRGTGRVLGGVRDLDVFMEQIRHWGGSEPGLAAGALEPLLAELHARREAAHEELLAWFGSAAWRRLVLALERTLRARASESRRFAAAPILATAPELIRRAYRRFAKQAARVRERTGATAEALHRLRIRGKRLRYALEFVEPVYGPVARPLIGAIVELQDDLGLQQDGEVARRWLEELSRERARAWPQAGRDALRILAHRYARRRSRLRGRVGRLLERITGARWRRVDRALRQGFETARGAALEPPARARPRATRATTR